MDIKFSIDYDYGNANQFLLVGDYKGTRFTEGVSDVFWGSVLAYKKWLIKRKFKILN